jgi:hypothetical protein
MIYELRRYTLHPGRRDELITLFEREFLEAQEAVGMRVTGTFRDPDAPDTFTWLRAFPDMEARRASLEAFYDGPVWQANRDAANATLIDSDDVLLLLGPPAPAWERPPAESPYVATIYHVEDGFAQVFAEQAVPVLAEAGVAPVIWLESEHAENTFPRLPVRTGENVFVWFAAVEREVELPMLDGLFTGVQRLRLRPTARSAMR